MQLHSQTTIMKTVFPAFVSFCLIPSVPNQNVLWGQNKPGQIIRNGIQPETSSQCGGKRSTSLQWSKHKKAVLSREKCVMSHVIFCCERLRYFVEASCAQGTQIQPSRTAIYPACSEQSIVHAQKCSVFSTSSIKSDTKMANFPSYGLWRPISRIFDCADSYFR